MINVKWTINLCVQITVIQQVRYYIHRDTAVTHSAVMQQDSCLVPENILKKLVCNLFLLALRGTVGHQKCQPVSKIAPVAINNLYNELFVRTDSTIKLGIIARMMLEEFDVTIYGICCSIHEQPVPHRSDPCRERAGHREADRGGEEESVTEKAEKAEDDDEGII